MFRIIGIETLSPPENEYKTSDGMNREQKMPVSIRKAPYHSVMKVLKPNQTICWITSLFHKNDAYQTPIVLNPFREKGNVDVNVERDLTHKRLFQLVIKNPQILNKILRNKHARSLIFDVDNNLNPVSGHRFSSLKVLQIMQKMHIILSIKSGIASRDVLNIGKRILASWGHILGYCIEPKKSD